jgi:glycosyltransferase involved in cell wall biosynthesis
MNKALIVAYHFPPDAAVGALRPLAFARYLPAYGWEPYVLTVKEKYYPRLDDSHVDYGMTSSGRVFRTRMVVHPSVGYRRLKAAYSALTARKQGASEGSRHETQEAGGVWHRTRRLVNSLSSLPDETLGWLPIATARAIQLIKRYKIDRMYTSGPPHTVHLIGLIVKKMTGVPWVADFRDPWASCWGNDRSAPARISAWMERRVVERADTVVTTTERMTRGFQDAYASAISPKHFLTILNGYESEDFADVERHRSQKFRIMYLGSLYHTRTPGPLFQALSELLAEKKLELDRLDVQLAGECEHANGRRLSDLIDARGLSQVVKVMAPVSHKQAVAHMVNCDLLLLLAPDQESMIPAKVFEYLASGSDILTLTQDGATGDLLRSFQRSVVVHPHDIRGMKEAVCERYARWQRGMSRPGAVLGADVRRYERRELTRELASVLQGCVVSE